MVRLTGFSPPTPHISSWTTSRLLLYQTTELSHAGESRKRVCCARRRESVSPVRAWLDNVAKHYVRFMALGDGHGRRAVRDASRLGWLAQYAFQLWQRMRPVSLPHGRFRLRRDGRAELSIGEQSLETHLENLRYFCRVRYRRRKKTKIP